MHKSYFIHMENEKSKSLSMQGKWWKKEKLFIINTILKPYVTIALLRGIPIG